MRSTVFYLLLPAVYASLLFQGWAVAQSAPAVENPTEASDTVDETRPSENSSSHPADPPASITETTSQETPPQTAPNLNVRFPVNQITVEGSTVLQDEIAALVAEYAERRELSFEELLELRSHITQLYVDNGYITSGAFLPNNQLLTDGIIRIQVVEGTLERIDLCLLSPRAGRINRTRDTEEATPVDQPTNPEANHDSQQSSVDEEQLQSSEQTVEETTEQSAPTNDVTLENIEELETEQQRNLCGSARLQEQYVRSRLAQVVTTPVSQQQIEEALQLLQLNPLIRRVDAELIAGSAPGQSILLVQVREASAFRFGIGGDNYQSPSIGSEQLSIQAGYDNVLGLGDRISAGYGRTEGLNSFDVGYAIPVNAQDGTVSVNYNRDESLIIEEDFEDLEIRSDSETISIGFRQPIVRRPETELALGLQLDLRQSTTFLEDEPFSFSIGPEDGESRVTVLRFSQDWVDRDARTVLAARSLFSFGVDAFDATVNDTGTDGRFFSWLGQFQWVQRLSSRWVLVSRVNAQLTPDSLLPLERFGYGGIDTVRGYRQNQLVTDNGILGAVETRFSLLPNSNRFQLIPFAEIGHGWNNKFPDPDPETIASVGLGFRWAITRDLAIGIDYGIPLIDVADEGNSLQDNGLYFSVRYQPL